jgi:pyruvate-ferredoxin/flavodoxin oxidoreductase
MAYGNVYVASVAMGASDQQTLRALLEAEAYDGPSLVIAYSHCIAHGIATDKGLAQQRLAVQSCAWLLYRYNPARLSEGKDAPSTRGNQPSRWRSTRTTRRATACCAMAIPSGRMN